MGIVYVFGLLLISCTTDASYPLSETGILANSERSVLPQPSWSCTKSGWQCKDCSTIQWCGRDFNSEFSVSCEDQYPAKKYCSTITNQCVADKSECDEFRNGFKCPNKGIYPDLVDCSKYISCAYKGDVGVTYNCLFNSTYNHNKVSCITQKTCYTTKADCGGKHKMIPYVPDNSLYVVCRGLDLPLLKDCGSKALRFNAVSMECEFQCQEEGYFAHPTNPKKYYICVLNGKTLVREERTCRDGTIYDEKYGCVQETTTLAPAPVTSTATVDITTDVPSTTLAPCTSTPSPTSVSSTEASSSNPAPVTSTSAPISVPSTSTPISVPSTELPSTTQAP